MTLMHRGRQLFKLLIASSLLLSAEARYFSTPVSLFHVRGGSSTGNPSDYYGKSGGDNLYQDGGAPAPDIDAIPTSMLQQESYQDRIDAWKTRQQEQYGPDSPSQPPQYSNRDAEGRLKLLTSVSKGSRALIFFMLLWRDVHLYEVADSNLKGLSRLFVVTPLCILFMANLAGVVASVTSPSHSAKKRLKAILNLDKLVEAVLIIYNFIRLTVWPSKYTPRELYIANTLHSVFFLLQSQAFTRVTWDQALEQPSFPATTTAPPARTEDSSLQYNNAQYAPNNFQTSGAY